MTPFPWAAVVATALFVALGAGAWILRRPRDG
jgi:hypothetical protein